MDDRSRTDEGPHERATPRAPAFVDRTMGDGPDPPWLAEGTRIIHSALGPGHVWRIDDHVGRRWVRLRLDPSGAVLAMPLDQLRPHVQLAEDVTSRGTSSPES